jgi:hypothetical protein
VKQQVVADPWPPLPMLGGQEGGPYSSPPLPGGEGGGMAGGCRVAGYRDQIWTRLSPSEEGWKLRI